MALIRVIPAVLREEALKVAGASAALRSIVPGAPIFGDANAQEQLAGRIAGMTADAGREASSLAGLLGDASVALSTRAAAFEAADGASASALLAASTSPAITRRMPKPWFELFADLGYLPRLVVEAILGLGSLLGLGAATQTPVTILPPDTQTATTASPEHPFTALPVDKGKIKHIEWYGNTQFAYEHRDDYYRQLQGLHDGVDFIVPMGTEIRSPVTLEGKVISIDNVPYDYKAGPHNVLVDYGGFLVLYGHTSDKPAVNLGAKVKPGDLVAYSGTDGSVEHLHLEVIKKDPQWKEGDPNRRPGSVRTNPVPYFSPDVMQQLEGISSGAFHPYDKWTTPGDQPDITPAEAYFIP